MVALNEWFWCSKKLLGEPWQRGEMEHTCVVHNFFSLKYFQDFLEGERTSSFCHLTESLASLTISATKSPWMEIYSVLTSASSLDGGFQFWLSPALKLQSKEGNCTFTPEQGARPFLHTPLHMLQLWQLLTLAPALGTRQGEMPCKQLLQSTYSFPWRVIAANFP